MIILVSPNVGLIMNKHIFCINSLVHLCVLKLLGDFVERIVFNSLIFHHVQLNKVLVVKIAFGGIVEVENF